MLEKNTPIKKLPLFLLFLASGIVALQIGFIVYAGDPLCLNEGCEIVEQLTKVPPLYINIAGIFYLQLLFWVLLSSRRQTDLSQRFYRLLLLAGMAAEGVLISFQYLIAETFCSYCLYICATIVVLNILAGGRQTVKGVLLFGTIFMTFSSLQFQQPASAGSLEEGVFAQRVGSKPLSQMHLFFSQTCPHCELIIQQLNTLPELSVSFHPIDTIENFHMDQAEIFSTYSTAANRQILATLGIKEVPVLLIKEQENMLLLTGEKNIAEKLRELSGTQPEKEEDAGTLNAKSTTTTSSRDDGCTIDEPCEDEPLIPGLNTSPLY